MNRRLPLLLLAGVLLGTSLGLVALYRLRMGQGDVFPPYSTLRADPLGLRGLHDSLADVPGITVTRWLRPLDEVPAAPARTLIMAGVTPEAWAHFTAEEFNALDAAVRGGCRLVIALSAPVKPPERREGGPAPAAKKDPAKPDEAKAVVGPKVRVESAEPGAKARWVDVAKLWGATLEHQAYRGRAIRAGGAPSELPIWVEWNSAVSFAPAQGVEWRVLYRGAGPVALERREGLGSIVLTSDSYFLSNEALQRNRAPALLVRLAGRLPRVEFIESHLGVADNPGFGVLARRYGLAPAFGMLLLLAGLFVWRRMAALMPPAPESDAVLLNYHQSAGLEALLRRAVPAAELLPACVAEWRITARATDRARVAAALAEPAAGPDGAAAYNALVRVLRRRR